MTDDLKMRIVCDNYSDIYNECQADIMQQALKYRKGDRLQFTKLTEYQLTIVWESFIRTGRVLHHKILDRIQYLMAWNTCLLSIITACMGHDQWCGIDEMVRSYELNRYQKRKLRYVFLSCKTEEFAMFSNGQWMLSDYGIKPLNKYLFNAMAEDCYEKKIVWLDAMLNVIHMRSDLAELFVEGGSNTLSKLSGDISAGNQLLKTA